MTFTTSGDRVQAPAPRGDAVWTSSRPAYGVDHLLLMS